MKSYNNCSIQEQIQTCRKRCGDSLRAASTNLKLSVALVSGHVHTLLYDWNTVSFNMPVVVCNTLVIQLTVTGISYTYMIVHVYIIILW